MPLSLERTADRAAVEARLLDIVAGLVAELGGPSARAAVLLDASLDRDLGIGSLERVELLIRLEQAFGIRLPDAVMVEADSPRDLVTVILSSRPAAPEAVLALEARPAAGGPAPAEARTLVEVLTWHVEANPERAHIFLRGEDEQDLRLTYRDLWTRAVGIAAGLRERGLEPGHSVALLLRTEESFFFTFFGALIAGGIPVPIYPPFRLDRLEEYARRQAGILRNAEARWLITFAQAERLGQLLQGSVPSLANVTTAERLATPRDRVPLLRSTAADPALIQYTSGSTGEPKGVLLSHANLLANIRAMGEAIAIRPDDVMVSWLPLYHDMGLIGAWLAPLYFGIPLVILSPLAFLARPARWLRALHAHRGTISAAPNFAYDLCARSVRDDEIPGLDLSAWRLAFNGSEPVNPETIERFARRFGPHGFRPEAMSPAYGLAEVSVALTLGPVGRSPRVDRVAREAFERQREARPAAGEEAHPLFFVSCGRPLPGHEVRIVDAAGRVLGERTEGRIEFRGPSVTQGYWKNPGATQTVLHDGWMDSGDLGYWADGELFVTGRQKDLIIKGGRNLHPHEVEEAAGSVPGIVKDCVAAFGVFDPAIGTERLVVVAETRETVPDGIERLRSAVLERVVAALGIPADTVVIVGPGTVPKTSSGKIRRRAAREAYVRGELAAGRREARAQRVWLLTQALKAWVRRATGRGRALAFAAYVGELLAFTAPIFWGLLCLVPRGRPAAGLVRAYCRGLLAASGCRVRIEGGEHLLSLGPAVVVSNHSSYVDSVVLLAAFPIDFRFVAKRELLETPIVGTVLRKVGHLAVERTDLARSVADAARATAALREGRPLLFFPEGTFVRAVGLRPFRLGAFKAAVESGLPVVPIGLRGTREVLPADTWLPRPGHITVTIGPPIKVEGRGWPEMVRLRDLARTEIARLSGEPLLEREL